MQKCGHFSFVATITRMHTTPTTLPRRCFEGALAACAAPLVGVVSDKVFGYRGAGTVSRKREVDLANAEALGNALLAFMLVPWTFTLLLYTGVWLGERDEA